MDEVIKKVETLFKKGQYKEIISLLPDALLDKYNNPDLYAWKARAHSKLGEIEETFEYSNKAIVADPNNPFGYFTRASAWHDKQELDKAIADYDKAIELKKDYSDAYFNRGWIWDDKGDYDKAIADYDKVIELTKDDAEALNNRGVAWKGKGEYDKAIADYSKAIKLKTEEANYVRNRGIAFYVKSDFQKAIADFQKAIELDKSFNFLEYNIKLAREKLEERKILEDSKAQQADKDEKLRIEKEIEALINAIREISKSRVKTVVHYTKVFVADIYVKSITAKMHYSNAIYMNDPMEGKIFFEYLNDKKIEEAYANGEKRTETSVYLGSFLPAEEDNGDISHEDELVMWRTYGKNETGKEAAGCSVVLSCDFFNLKTSGAKESSANIKAGEDLLNVIYIKRQKNKKEITNTFKTEIEPVIKKLKSQLLKLIDLKNKYKRTDDFYKEIENTIFKQLSSISYLFKSADYNFEHEVRVITYMPRDSDTIKHMPISEPNAPCKRFYIESYNAILPHVKRIYLGPKVENSQQWGLYLDYEIRQRAKDLKIMPDPPYQLKPSDIEIVRSICKFQ